MGKSKIYTRTGDKGTTSLVGGKRVSKYNQRLECYGTVDELNSFIGLLSCDVKEASDLEMLHYIQNKLFSVGSYLATDQETTDLRMESHITQESIAHVEAEIDQIDGQLTPLKNFILPGGGRATSLAHVCRTVCRRCERGIIRLAEDVTIEETVLTFVNRLSDYFFVLARKLCKENNEIENIWEYISN